MAINGKWRYEDLTWAEMNQAIEAGLIPVLPVGTMEQHGPHLPVKMDRWTATEVARAASEQHADRRLFMPPVAYGYTTHVMDFPGSITVHDETFIRYIVDILKSLAYHGFSRIIVINGHRSNMPPLDLACRRANIETDANIALTSWWNLTAVDPEFMKTWRESGLPRGCAHSGEAETSMALHMDAGLIQMDRAVNEKIKFNEHQSPYQWIDLWEAGPMSVTSWASKYTDSGVCGDALLATPEKGKLLFNEAVKNLTDWSDEFYSREVMTRKDHHTTEPLSNLPG